MITIENQGRKTVIATRDQESSFSCDIKHISCTSEQPYIAVNFDQNGKAVGGKTMTSFEVENLVAMAKQKGFQVDGVLNNA